MVACNIRNICVLLFNKLLEIDSQITSCYYTVCVLIVVNTNVKYLNYCDERRLEAAAVVARRPNFAIKLVFLQYDIA